MNQSMTRAELGALGEQFAVDHLTGLGLQVIGRNWRCRYGELDVIAVEPETRTVIFVEVKTRTTDRFGGIAEAVTHQKLRRLRRLAGLWLADHEGSWAQVRIDVVGLRIRQGPVPPGGRGREVFELTHLQGVG